MPFRTQGRGVVHSTGKTDAICSITLLGGFAIRVQDRAFALPTRKGAALLAMLSFHGGEAIRREALMAELWPDVFEESARTSLRQALARVRRTLEAAGLATQAITANRQTILLEDVSIQTDVHEFERLVAGARESEGDEKLALLVRAQEAYSGPLLDGFDEPWILPERLRLETLFLSCECELAAALSERKRYEEALTHAARAVETDAYSEAARIELVRSLLGLRRTSEARAQVQDLERVLQADLLCDPSAPTQRTFEHWFDTADRAGDGLLGFPFARSRKAQVALVVVSTLAFAVVLTGFLFHPSRGRPEDQFPGAAGWVQPPGNEVEAHLSRLHANPASKSGEDAAQWLGEEGWHSWYGRQEQVWMSTLGGADRDLTLAIEWALANDPARAVKITGALCHYWSIGGGFPRSRSTNLKRALASRAGTLADRTRAYCGWVDSRLLIGFDQSPATARRTVKLAEEAVAMSRQLSDRWGEARASWFLGLADAYAQEPARSIASYQSAIRLFGEVHDPNGVGWVQFCLAQLPWVMVKSGRPPGANLDQMVRSLEFFKSSGNRFGYELAVRGILDRRYFLTAPQRETIRTELLNTAWERGAHYDQEGASQARNAAKSLDDPTPDSEKTITYNQNGLWVDPLDLVDEPMASQR